MFLTLEQVTGDLELKSNCCILFLLYVQFLTFKWKFLIQELLQVVCLWMISFYSGSSLWLHRNYIHHHPIMSLSIFDINRCFY
ncbi:hypothetical protein M6B38_102385 [Iris pallida]|uniref:Uncharacterized protein n=1 Tax=Iris pallida TaxID=29817 RepID=A0AAX6INJ8_IRIPA|nr:hypothetical protein M6B38_102385 [Iris pallida]